MVNYPDFSNLSSNPTIGDFMSLPNSSYPYFWAWVMFGIWFIIAAVSYFSEKKDKVRGNILSSMSVACFAILVLSLIGRIFNVISLEIFIYEIAISFAIIGIWILTGNK